MAGIGRYRRLKKMQHHSVVLWWVGGWLDGWRAKKRRFYIRQREEFILTPNVRPPTN